MNIYQVLISLSDRKPFFISEKDFQYGLCEELRKLGFKCVKSSTYLGQKIDILVEDLNQEVIFAIQLRHKTATLSVDINNESFSLKNHGAQDQARYDFIKDIFTLEKISLGNKEVKGFAILLTNDHKYWEFPTKLNSVDEDFLIYEGKVLAGNLGWSSLASKGTKFKREDNLSLLKEYKCRWETYSSVKAKENNLFKLLVLEV